MGPLFKNKSSWPEWDLTPEHPHYYLVKSNVCHACVSKILLILTPTMLLM